MPKILQGKAQTPVDEAVLHCAAVSDDFHTRHTLEKIVTIVRGWHWQRGWSDIGYHYVITPDGRTAPGRPLARPGAHVAGHNSGKLGILLIEKRKIVSMGKFRDYFTDAQRRSVSRILMSHDVRFLSGHNDYTDQKLCPGFYVNAADFGARRPPHLPNR